MTAYEVIAQLRGIHSAEGLGSWKTSWKSYDASVRLADGGELIFRRTMWGHNYSAVLPGGHVLASFEKGGWLGLAGKIRWDGVDYDFSTKGSWQHTYGLTRHDEELANFEFTSLREHVKINVPGPTVPPAGLLLFAAWIAWEVTRSLKSTTSR